MALQTVEIEHPTLKCELCGDPLVVRVQYMTDWDNPNKRTEVRREEPTCYNAYKHV